MNRLLQFGISLSWSDFTWSAFSERVGWTLVHSLWQFTLIAALVLAVSQVGWLRSPTIRYWVLTVSLSLIAAAPIVTWWSLAPQLSSIAPIGSLGSAAASREQDVAIARDERVLNTPRQDNAATTQPTSDVEPSPAAAPKRGPASDRATKYPAWRAVVSEVLEPWLPTIATVWCCGVAFFSLRPVVGWINLWRLQTSGVSAAPAEVLQLLVRLQQRLGLTRSVRVRQSTRVRVPMVLGCVRSVILLPAALMSNMSLAQVEAILAHELAHVRRYDYWVNAAQVLVETFYFYHPAVWWLSRQIRHERENCCDDIAVELLGDRVAYGHALLALEEWRAGSTSFALGAHGGDLLARIRRLIRRNECRREPVSAWGILAVLVTAILGALTISVRAVAEPPRSVSSETDPAPTSADSRTWMMWGGSPNRNHVSSAMNVPTSWDLKSGENVKWRADLGSASYASPVITESNVLIGTNNERGRIARYPSKTDLACLMCFERETGKFLWQYSSEKLPTGRVHDWPGIGLCATPSVLGDRVWLTTNRGEVVCLDLEGFRDGQNDGPVANEPADADTEADVVWRCDMMRELGVSPMYQCCSSPALVGDLLLVNTSNGLDESHLKIPAPGAPNFLALNRHTGHVVWRDSSPGNNLLGALCPSASPAVAVVEGTTQAIFAGADGWVYSFDVREMTEGRTRLLWKFDINAKTARYHVGNRSERNVVVAAPVVWDQRVYVASGCNPEHGEGNGVLWCVDPRKRGDLSEELVFNRAAPDQVIPHKRLQACEPDKGDFTRPNPNSGVIWKATGGDVDGDGKVGFEETVHRTCAVPTIADGLLFLADFSGVVHCFDARTGAQLWFHDVLAAIWATPIVADGRLYVVNEDGEVTIFRASRKKELLGVTSMQRAAYSTPAVVDGMLYFGTANQLIAVGSSGTQPKQKD